MDIATGINWGRDKTWIGEVHVIPSFIPLFFGVFVEFIGLACMCFGSRLLLA